MFVDGETKICFLSLTVAFSVSFSEDGHPINVGNNAPIPFNHVTTNTGNGYDQHTGIFSVPTSGVYAFFMTAREHSSTSGYIVVGIRTTHAQLCRTAVQGTDYAQWDKGSCFAAVHLDQGDQVHVQRVGGPSAILDKGWQTAFSGVLITADL